ncbi:uncharacterized protein LOC118435798 [Folsomia candida]|uniref:uncharacterized protein LOC118435798 n=1 Tax=Folsomia candida TaxID=158441 RepID=UPI0016055935|nr:uncharacterized protein LOC118435798 [Folsomia candida]
MSGTCCFGCCTEGHGTLIIGILNIIGAILSMILNFIWIFLLINHPDEIEKVYIRQDPHRYITFSCIYIFMAIVNLIFSCLMVHGYRVRNHRFIMPWFVWNYASLCVVAVMILIRSLINPSSAAVLIGGLYLAVGTYYSLVVKRFVDELKGGLIY